MNVEPNQRTPLPEPSASPEDQLTVAQERIRELEDALSDCEQELAAASEIIEEQDWQIEELKAQLEGADRCLEEGAEARRKLEWRLAEVEKDKAAETDEMEACQVIDEVQKGRFSVPLPPSSDMESYPPGYKPNPVVEALIAQFKAREKK